MFSHVHDCEFISQSHIALKVPTLAARRRIYDIWGG